MMDRETNTLAARGLEELFSSCAFVSVFCNGGKLVLVLHTYVRYLKKIFYELIFSNSC